eukprot:5078055-Alexandrium_andersonii.AAC.1
MGRGDAALPVRAGECEGWPAVWAGLITACGGLLTLGGGEVRPCCLRPAGAGIPECPCRHVERIKEVGLEAVRPLVLAA